MLSEREEVVALVTRAPDYACVEVAAHPPSRECGASVVFLDFPTWGPDRVERLRATAEALPRALIIGVGSTLPPLAEEQALHDAGMLAIASLEDDPLRALMCAAYAVRRILTAREARTQVSAALQQLDRLASLGSLLATIVHEINTPAQAVVSNLEVIRYDLERRALSAASASGEGRRTPSPSLAEALTDSLAAMRRIQDIVASTRRFTYATERAIDLVPTNVGREVWSTLRLLGKDAQAGATFQVDLASDELIVDAPPQAIGQILTNLLLNAVHALREVEPARRLVHINAREEGSSICLEVVDCGPGIAPDVARRIFEPFFTTKPIGEGTGLGLPVTRELVTKLGGSISVDSTPGLGTCFRVLFPRATLTSPVGRKESVAPATRATRTRLLLVDDDELVLRALERALRAEFDCLTASSAEGALAVLRESPPVDVVVTDLVMRDSNGLELLDGLGAIDAALRRRVVFLSGDIQSTALARAASEAGCPMLEKPISPADLAKVIREVAARARSDAA